MKSFVKMLLIGIAAGAAAVTAGRLLRRRMRRPFVKRTEDVIEYSALSPETLEEENLTDLNEAAVSELAQLGLDEEMAGRVVENRPFRNKLELLSRRVIPEQFYEIIKNKVAVAKANETIKIA